MDGKVWRPASVFLLRFKPDEGNHCPPTNQRQRKGEQTQIKGPFSSTGALLSSHSVSPPAEASAEQGRVQKTASQEFFNIKP